MRGLNLSLRRWKPHAQPAGRLMAELQEMQNNISGDDWGDVAKWGSNSKQLFDGQRAPGVARDVWSRLTDEALNPATTLL